MVHDNIRLARTLCGYTQQQMADFLGINRSSYTYYETGHTPLPINLLLPMERAFGVSVDWLLKNDIRFEDDSSPFTDMFERQLPGLAKLTPEERSLLLTLRKYDLTEKVFDYAVILAKESEESAGKEAE